MFSHTLNDDKKTVVITYLEQDSPITAEDFFTRLQDEEFAIAFSKRLVSQPFEAAFWECPVFSPETAHEPFECVLIDSHELLINVADSTAFTRKLADVADNGTGVFPNVDNSATLISPQAKTADFGHLLAFLRQASPSQIANLWAITGKLVLEKSRSSPLWVSTSGLGVPWLHIRLDTQPKYYRHERYKALHL